MREGTPSKTNSATPVCFPGDGCGSFGCEGPWHTMVCVTIAPLRLSVTTCCAGCHFSRLATCAPHHESQQSNRLKRGLISLELGICCLPEGDHTLSLLTEDLAEILAESIPLLDDGQN